MKSALALGVALFALLGVTVWWATDTIERWGAPMPFWTWFFMITGMAACIALAAVLFRLMYMSHRLGFDEAAQELEIGAEDADANVHRASWTG